MKTMMEAKSAIICLEQTPEFQNALNDAGREFRGEVKEFLRIANSDDLKDIRNDIGGHVKLQAVKNTLKDLDRNTEGVLDVGRTHKETHFKFTSELMARMLTIHKFGEENKLAAACQ